MKSMALSKYFEYRKPKYLYFRLTPLKSLRNYNSDKLLILVAKMYKSLTQRVVRDGHKCFFNPSVKVSYYIYMEKEKVEFYFIIPSQYETLFIDKIGDVWKGVTIEQVDSIPFFTQDCLKYSMRYHKEDSFSLATDKRNNALLTSLMSAINVMEQGDKLGVFYNFCPMAQRNWKSDYDHFIEKYKDGFPIEKAKTNIRYIIKLLGRILEEVFEFAFRNLENITGEKVNIEKPRNTMSDILPETKSKRNAQIIKTQILILSESESKERCTNNAISACEAFSAISSDNMLDYKPIRKPSRINFTKKHTKLHINGVDTILASPTECQNFLSLPAKQLIEEHKIKCIDTFETCVPKQLQSGVVNIGESSYRGDKNNVYLCNDPELRNLGLCITGSNRSGKTTFISNIIGDYLEHGECVFIPDYCGNCELTNHLKSVFGSKVLEIECSDYETMEGLGYNEVKFNEENMFKRYVNAKMQATQFMTFINSVNEDDKALKAKMDRYLEAASLIVFINGGSIKDVFSVLQSYKTRNEFISRVPENQLNNLEEYIEGLRELDDVNKNGDVIGTRHVLITGIIDRLNILKKNSYVELMLKKSCENNINLLHEIQKSQIICVRMPESMFTTSTEKDLFCTYWFSKLWLSLQLRKNDIERNKHVKVNIVIDELYQVEKCQALISSKLSQMPKFTAKLVVSCHYLDQIPTLRNELRASNASYMILQGSNVKNYASLKAEFSNLNYTVDDLLNLKRFQSLNLLSYEEGYWAGITSLPKPREKFNT